MASSIPMSTLAILMVLVSSPSVLAAERPLVIAHRGASGYLPEHTLEAYRLAIDMGADFIEPDLVATKDGHLIARHENEMSGTTDVAERFPDRKAAKTIDGLTAEGWFSEDFTLAEIKTLRARERLPGRSHANDGKFTVPTFRDVLDLVAREGARRGRPVGVYPETKHPTYFRRIGLPLEPPLIAALKEAGLDRPDAPVYVQSFEVQNLMALAENIKTPLVQLLGDPDERPADGGPAYGEMVGDAGLREIARYAKGIGPPKAAVTADFVARAHAAGLVVHPYTFRSDAPFLAPVYNGDPGAEYCRYFAFGIDGVFSDFPDHALRARDTTCSTTGPPP